VAIDQMGRLPTYQLLADQLRAQITSGALRPGDRRFHRRLAEATGNPLYELITHPLYEVANERTLGEHAPAGFWHQVDAHHRAILRAVAAGDAPAARGAARAHLEHMRGAYAGLALRVHLGAPPPG
jgi:DNA-binding FadR family transcriptional regulator